MIAVCVLCVVWYACVYQKGETALMKATAKGHVYIAECLIKAGSDVNVKDNIVCCVCAYKIIIVYVNLCYEYIYIYTCVYVYVNVCMHTYIKQVINLLVCTNCSKYTHLYIHTTRILQTIAHIHTHTHAHTHTHTHIHIHIYVCVVCCVLCDIQHGNTVLFWAAFYRRTYILKCLLDVKVNVNTKNHVCCVCACVMYVM